MKKTTLFFALWLVAGSAAAQFGINAGYRFNNAPGWQAVYQLAEESVLTNHWAAGIDYWFRLKDYRVEFLPELNFAASRNSFFAAEGASHEANLNAYSLFFNTNFYVFDFMGDCDCPTFSKQGSFGKKGFFLQLSPGLSFLQQSVERPDATFRSRAVALSLGAGVGFDFGITDLITFSPMLSLRYYPSVAWDSLPNISDGLVLSARDSESAITQVYAGARLGFRVDYKNRRR